MWNTIRLQCKQPKSLQTVILWRMLFPKFCEVGREEVAISIRLIYLFTIFFPVPIYCTVVKDSMRHYDQANFSQNYRDTDMSRLVSRLKSSSSSSSSLQSSCFASTEQVMIKFRGYSKKQRRT